MCQITTSMQVLEFNSLLFSYIRILINLLAFHSPMFIHLTPLLHPLQQSNCFSSLLSKRSSHSHSPL